MNCLSLRCLETVSVVIVARQHLHYMVEMVSMVIILQTALSQVACKQFP